MRSSIEKTSESTSSSGSNAIAHQHDASEQGSSTLQMPSDTIQNGFSQLAKESIQAKKSNAIQHTINNSIQLKQVNELQLHADQHASIHKTHPVQRKENNTGLPDQLKSGIENLSGHSMDDVQVHYNSDKPASLLAHAYAQGTDIHLAPGQEKHLAHEAWHVAQQKQGRVQPTTQLKGSVQVNDDPGLEQEADIMGAKALQAQFDERTEAGSPIQGKFVKSGIHNDSNPDHSQNLPIQRVVKSARVTWGITHIVQQTDGTLFGGVDALENEGMELRQGDVLTIDDAPVLISRRGSNQENAEKRAEDKKGDTVKEWVSVLQVSREGKVIGTFDKGAAMYVRNETISMMEEERKDEEFRKNKIELHNITDWDEEGIPGHLRSISAKWENRGKLTRSLSSGVEKINEEDMEGGMPSGRHWDQYHEGVNVANDMADEDHKPHPGKRQWRIKAVNKDNGDFVGVLIAEETPDRPLYIRWMIGNPEIKGGGTALLTAVKILLQQHEEAAAIEVTSAYSAGKTYKNAGFKPAEGSGPVSKGEEFELVLTKEDSALTPIKPEYNAFKPEEYQYKEKPPEDD